MMGNGRTSASEADNHMAMQDGSRANPVISRESAVDRVSEWVGKAVSAIVLAMIAVVCYNVFVRFVLNAPTSWSYDVNYLLGGSMMALGQAFVMKHDEHVRIDVVSTRLSTRARLIIETTLTAALFVPLVLLMCTTYWADFYTSFIHGDTFMQTAWYPLKWPFKLVVALGFTLLFLQGLNKLVNLIGTFRRGEEQS